MNTPDERELERFLQRESVLSRAWRETHAQEPSTQTDAAILAAARREVGARPRPASAPFSSSWRVPLSLAAVLVVSVTLTLLLSEEQPVQEPVPPSAPAFVPTPASPAQADRAAQADRSEPASKRAATASNATQSSGEALSSSAAPESISRADSANQLAREPAAKARQAEEKFDSALELQVETFARRSDAPPPAAASPAAGEPSAKMQALPAPEAPVQSMQDIETRELSQAPAAALSKQEQKAQVPAAGAGASRHEGQRRRAYMSPQQPARDQAEMEPMPQEQDAPAAWRADPEAWLRHIDDLRRIGRMQEAKQELREFVQRHPDFPLPAALQALP